MRDGVVIRQGREKYVGDRNDWCFMNVCLPILCFLAFVGFVFNLYSKETFYESQQLAIQEVEHMVQELPNAEASTLRDSVSKSNAAIVHATGRYTASVIDPPFNIRTDQALKLKRYTEYCQWAESSHDKCQKCTRQGKDGKEESYDCNCIRQYTYIKAWRSHLIPSFGFDQPANHHNPLRDPFPSTTIFSGDATMGAMQIAETIVEKTRAHLDPLAFSKNGMRIRPGFFTSIWHSLFGAPNTRFEGLEELRSFYRSSAYHEHHFVYTNTYEGWFFSAYEASSWEKLIRGVGQFLEGSLFDWQIGDLYDIYNGCTPGDLRTRYYVADPDEISVLGRVEEVGSGAFHLMPFITSKNFPVGYLHAGVYSPDDMFAAEESIAKSACQWARFGNLFSGAAATYLMTKFGLWNPSSTESLVSASIGISLILMSLVWVAAYGLSDWSGGDSDVWTIVALLCGVGLIGWSLQERCATAKKLK